MTRQFLLRALPKERSCLTDMLCMTACTPPWISPSVERVVGRHGGSSGHFCLPHFGFVPSVSRRCWMPGCICRFGFVNSGPLSKSGDTVAFGVCPWSVDTPTTRDTTARTFFVADCGSALPCHVHSLISMRRLLRHVRATSAENGASHARGGPVRLRRRPTEEAVETGYATPLEGLGRLGLPKPGITSCLMAPHTLLLCRCHEGDRPVRSRCRRLGRAKGSRESPRLPKARDEERSDTSLRMRSLGLSSLAPAQARH